jgi:hypothetical protein
VFLAGGFSQSWLLLADRSSKFDPSNQQAAESRENPVWLAQLSASQ